MEYVTEKGSFINVGPNRANGELEWLDEDNCCVDCAVDLDATKETGYTHLIWNCDYCGGGSAPLKEVI